MKPTYILLFIICIFLYILFINIYIGWVKNSVRNKRHWIILVGCNGNKIFFFNLIIKMNKIILKTLKLSPVPNIRLIFFFFLFKLRYQSSSCGWMHGAVFNKCYRNRYLYFLKILNSYVTLFTNIYLTWIIDLNVKEQTIKCP